MCDELALHDLLSVLEEACGLTGSPRRGYMLILVVPERLHIRGGAISIDHLHLSMLNRWWTYIELMPVPM